MPEIPLLSSRDIVRTLEKFGWRVVRRKGSHVIMIREGYTATLSIPDRKEVARGTLRSLIRSADLTVVDFLDAFND